MRSANDDKSSVGFTNANAVLSGGMEVAVFLTSDGVSCQESIEQIAGEAAEHLADRGRGLARRVLEEDVIGVGDLDGVVAASAAAALLVAALDRLDQDGGGVGGDAEVPGLPHVTQLLPAAED